MATDWTTDHLNGTNERRVKAVTSAATFDINADIYGAVNVSALAVAVTSVTVSGTPDDLQPLTIRIKDAGVAKALAFGSQFEAVGAALPVITVAGKRMTLQFVYDSAAAKWGLIYAAVEA